MRTTLTIDDDVLAAVRERARRENRTAGEVLSDLARQALTGPVGNDGGWFIPDDGLGIPALRSRGGIVTSQMVRALLDEDPHYG